MKIDFMKVALKEAFSGMRKGEGGPFGAVIVRGGKIVSRAHNCVLKTNDPTMHAEVGAIRKATKKLKRFDLSDCVLFTTCEPCPMCFSAIQWAKIKTIYYGCTREEAARIGFSDKKIYDDIKLAPKSKNLTMIPLCNEEIKEPFNEWIKKKNKKMY